jgi:predicted HicB family RNase H-like nuclease
MQQQSDTKKTVIRMPAQQWRELRIEAAKQDTSVNFFVNRAIIKALEGAKKVA